MSFVSLPERLQQSAERLPDGEALVDGVRRISYRELAMKVRLMARFLQRGGLQRGDRVAILLHNSVEYVVAYYGALAAGGVAVGLNPSARIREVGAWLDHCAPRVLFLSSRHADAAALKARADERLLVVLPETYAEDGDAPVDNPPVLPIDLEPEHAAAIIYTSGTTGRPKGVTLSHRNLTANVSSIIEYLELSSSDRVLNPLPFFYSYGCSVLHTHLAVGATLVLENSLLYPTKTLARLSEERITGFPGVPSMFALLLQSADFGVHDLSTVRYVTQAGGPMPVAVTRRLRDAMPKARIFVMYGQTEATARLTYVPPERLEEKLGSVGIPVPGVRIEIRDETDRRAKTGRVGEVCARGPNVMLGYYQDEDATRAVLRNGWLRTGDLGRIDADGYLFLEGRRSDMIKSGAHRISPLDIEEVIAELPQVAEAAVVGVPDTILGESIKAVIALRPGAVLTLFDVQRHCIAQLPRYKVPREVEFRASLPRTPSGKVQRYQLMHPATAS